MASTEQKAKLDILRQMIDEVLVQSGRAFRAAQRAGQTKDMSYAENIIRSKTVTTDMTFQLALDHLEGEVIDAKSVLVRDLNAIRAKRAPPLKLAQTPTATTAPVETPNNDPIQASPQVNIDDKAEVAVSTPQQQKADVSSTQAVAPFPDMGMGMMEVDQSPNNASTIKTEPMSISTPTATITTGLTPVPAPTPAIKVEGRSTASPLPQNISLSDPQFALGPDPTTAALQSEGFSFTDMEFTLAIPPEDNTVSGIDLSALGAGGPPSSTLGGGAGAEATVKNLGDDDSTAHQLQAPMAGMDMPPIDLTGDEVQLLDTTGGAAGTDGAMDNLLFGDDAVQSMDSGQLDDLLKL